MKNYLTLFFVIVCSTILSQCPKTNIILIKQSEVDSFGDMYPNCKIIKGDLTIKSADIFNLNGLNNIQSISGYLNIGYNKTLKNLEGLNNLKSIGGDLSIGNNDALSNFEGLNNLETIGGFLDIFRNPSLLNLLGLDNLQSINGNFNIKNNNHLSNLLGINNLKAIGGHLRIYDNSFLENLNGLNGLQSIGNNLILGFNSKLKNFTGINNLQKIGGSLSIYSNLKLINLSGLENLNAIGGELFISNNTSLNNIDGIFNIDPNSIKSQDNFTKDIEITDNPYLSKCAIKSICGAIGLNKTLNIQNNNSLCNSTSQVEKSCDNLSTNNLDTETSVKIYPNPTTSITHIEANSSVKKIEIYSLSGKLLDIFNSSNYIFTHKYPSGIYIFMVYTDKGIYEQKVIKK